MEKNRIEFRPVRRSDYDALEKIICDTWHYECFCSPKTARSMSRLYLASCLSSQDFTCAAINNGEPVGVIMARDERRHRTPARYAIRCLVSAAAMLTSKEGRKISNMYGGFAALNKELLKESGRNFDGELAFFAIRSDQRGTGIGKALFDRALRFMKSQNIENFCLYTDTTCNFGFYEHQGMVRINERTYSLKPYCDQVLSFFLYGGRSDAMCP